MAYFPHWLHAHTYPMAMAYGDLVRYFETDEAARAQLVTECRHHDRLGLLPYQQALSAHERRMEQLALGEQQTLQTAFMLGALTMTRTIVEDDEWEADATAFLHDAPFLKEAALFPPPFGDRPGDIASWSPRQSFFECWHRRMSPTLKWCFVRLHAEWTHKARNEVAVRLGVPLVKLGETEADRASHPPPPQRLHASASADTLYWEVRLLLATCTDLPFWVPWVVIGQYALAFAPFEGVDDLDILDSEGDPYEGVFLPNEARSPLRIVKPERTTPDSGAR